MEEFTITKLQAAHKQVITAISMNLSGGDPVSVHTLACSAREIYEKHCKAKGIKRFFDLVQQDHPDRSEKNLWDEFNDVRNFLKHPEINFDLNATVVISDSLNKNMLFCACHDCAVLCKEKTPLEVDLFNLWFLATKQDASNDCASQFGSQFTNLQDKSIEEQRRIGLQFLNDEVSGSFKFI